MSSTDSAIARKVDDILRNQWTIYFGFSGRHAPDLVDDMLRIMHSIKNGNKTRGRQLLIRVLENDENNETAWLWLTKCLSSNKQKNECFERVLEINPNNQHAKDGLKRLDTLSKVKEHPSKESNSPHSKKPQKEGRSSKKKIILILSVILFILLCIILPLATIGSEKDENKVTVCYSGDDWADRVTSVTGYNVSFTPANNMKNWDMSWQGADSNGAIVFGYNEHQGCITKAAAVVNVDPIPGQVEKFGLIFGSMLGYFQQTNWADEKIEECLYGDIDYSYTDKNGSYWNLSCETSLDKILITVQVDMN